MTIRSKCAISSYRNRTGSVEILPFLQQETDPDTVGRGIVIEQALPVSVEILDISAHPREEWKTPRKLQTAPVVVESQIVPKQKPEPVPMPQVESVQLAVAKVILDVGIVVVCFVLRYAVPDIEKENEAVPLETEIRHHAVPASGQRFGTPVGLVIETDIDEAPPEPQETIIRSEIEQKFGLEICFAER
jgi:hypothetical protein